MTTTIFSRLEARTLLKLALPLILTGFLESSVGFFATLFLARLGPHALAAGAVAQWVFFTIMVIIWGTLSSVSVLIAQKYGEKDHQAISMVLRDGLLLAAILIIPSVLLLRNISPILIMVGQEPALVKLGQSYMNALSWGMPADLIGIVLMQFLIGLGHTRTNMIFTLSYVPISILSYYVFVFGKLGFPALGIAGIGWGTSFSFILLAIALIIFLKIKVNYQKYTEGIFKAKTPRFLKELFQIGLPMGSMYCIEVAFFLTLTLLMGKFGAAFLAANQITLQFLGMVSVVTFSLAQAITVRLGHTSAIKNKLLAEQITCAGIFVAVSFMLLVAFVYTVFPEKLIMLDLNLHDPKNAEIIFYAKKFLFLGAMFQIVEAVRFSFFGALRGFKDTRFTLLVSILSFWGISLPVGYALAIFLDLSGSGLWAGTVVGQIVAVILLFLRFRYKIRQNQIALT